MGSVQKRAFYDKLHARYGEKYPELDPRMIRAVRQRVLTGQMTREQVVADFNTKIEKGEALLEKLQHEHDILVKAFNWLQTCNEEMFKDITERNPKLPKEEIK